MNLFDNYSLSPIAQWESEVFADHYLTWANDAEVTHHLYQGTFPVSKEDASSLYAQYTNNNNLVYYITHDEEVVGCVGIHEIHWPSRVGEYRVLIGNKDHWGKGVGKRSLDGMLKLAFDRFNFHKVYLGFSEAHTRAQKAYSQSGLKHEGTLIKHHYKNGKYHDIIRMYILREDYESLKKDS